MIYIGTAAVLPKHPIYLAVSQIYGVGYGRAWWVHLRAGAHSRQRLGQEATRAHRKLWYNNLKRRFLLGATLKALKRANIKRLKYIKCRRGVRHGQFLPTRGQRTHSNRRNPRYLGRRTWQYVPTTATAKLKKVRKYVRHKPGLVERSNAVYAKLLERNFAVLQKNKRYFKYLTRQGKLGQFTKLAKQKKLLPMKKQGKKTSTAKKAAPKKK